MTVIEEVKEVVWLKGLVAKLNLVQLESTLKGDSQSTIYLIEN